MLSDRTAKYFEALIREGPNFNYLEWFHRVQGEEAQANNVPGAVPHRELCDPSIISESQEARLNSAPAIIAKPGPIPAAAPLSDRQAESVSSKALLRRRIDRVRDAWNAFQASRARDAVYGYLGAVLAIVRRYEGRRKRRWLLRQACKIGELRFDERAELFATIIRCTSNGSIDNKTISKWSRALRYVTYSDVDKDRLKIFMKEKGGINACAACYARVFRRDNR